MYTYGAEFILRHMHGGVVRILQAVVDLTQIPRNVLQEAGRNATKKRERERKKKEGILELIGEISGDIRTITFFRT